VGKEKKTDIMEILRLLIMNHKKLRMWSGDDTKEAERLREYASQIVPV